MQNVPEEQQEWEALNDAAVVDQWEPEMLLMPGAGLPRNLMQVSFPKACFLQSADSFSSANELRFRAGKLAPEPGGFS